MEFSGTLKNAPLFYVLAALNFPVIVGIEKYLEDIQEGLRKEYPMFDQLDIQSLQVNLEQEGPQTRQGQISIWQFADENYEWAVALSNQQIILQTRRYVDFESFSDRLLKILNLVGKVVGISHYVRLGIRYIDLIAPHDDETLPMYLPSAMLGQHIDGIIGRQIDGITVSSYETASGKLLIRCWLNPPEVFPPDLAPLFQLLKYHPIKPEKDFALMDTDHVYEDSLAKVFDVEQIIEKLDTMHGLCHKAFEMIPTDHAFKVWGKES